MAKAFIECKNISYTYGEEEESVLAIDNLSLTINEGEFVAILGHNGSGKSTLSKHFNGILVPLKGDVIVDGINTRDEERLFELRSRVGMVFQNPDNQIVATIVEEDVAFAPENLGIEPSEIRKRVDEALKTVGMYKYKDHQPHKLSGGQKQRVAIAGVLAMNPKCIILDEPTAMLDPEGRAQVMRTIEKLSGEGITVVLITHFMDEAARAGRVVVMNDGKVILDGTPREVFREEEKLLEVGLAVPPVTHLCSRLSKAGLPIQPDIISEEECLENLRKILAKN